MNEWPVAHWFVLKRLFDFEKIVYIPGNHDSFLRNFWGRWKHVLIIDMYRHRTANNKYYIITHGDKFDPWIQWTGFISTSWIAKTTRWLFDGLHARVTMRDGYKNKLAKLAKNTNCHGVICGHSHVAEHDVIDKIEYWNCGCWTADQFHVIIEDEKGHLSLVKL